MASTTYILSMQQGVGSASA